MPNARRITLATYALAIFVTAGSFLASTVAAAQVDYQPAPENLKARTEFQDAKFGMFIHRGAYSVLGAGEWVFYERRLTLDQYNRLPSPVGQ